MADCSKIGEEDELMLELELSIGGIFGKSNRNVSESMEKDDGIVDLNVQSKGNIEALRRRELRRKREETVKKPVDSGSSGSVSGPFVENREWLEAQAVRRNDEPARKKEKVGNMPEKVEGGGGQVVAPIDGDKSCGFRRTDCGSFRPYQWNVNLKSEIDGNGGRCYCKMNSNGCASSVYSDGQCSSHQGGATDDSRSNSSNSQLDQQPASTSTASLDPSNQPTGSSKQTVSTTKPTTGSTASALNPVKPNDRLKPHESSVLNPPSKPEPQHQQASLLARMPCVSTTGNGPNGKTVSGFLHRYTKNEVSIVCVCHGRSFSPAGFVEHAGGVDIAQPLKHITIFPAAFAS